MFGKIKEIFSSKEEKENKVTKQNYYDGQKQKTILSKIQQKENKENQDADNRLWEQFSEPENKKQFYNNIENMYNSLPKDIQEKINKEVEKYSKNTDNPKSIEGFKNVLIESEYVKYNKE